MGNRVGTAMMRTAYKLVGKPVIFHMEPDDAHEFMIRFCTAAERSTVIMRLLHFMTLSGSDAIGRNLMGLHFNSPIGLSAGLDKDGVLVRCLDEAGFGFEMVGSMTAEANPGNPRPWYHRLPQYRSLVIHAGLPSKGTEAVERSMNSMPRRNGMILSGSIGFTNREFLTPEGNPDIDAMIADYARSYGILAKGSQDMIEVNVSCPNVGMGEPFSDAGNVDRLFTELDRLHAGKPVSVKLRSTRDGTELAPTLDVLARHRVDMVSIANLRKDRNGYDVPAGWEGGLSGRPAQEYADDAIAFVRREYGKRFVINGIGGVFTRDDLARKLDAGADLVSLITAFMFEGPQLAAELNNALAVAARNRVKDKQTWLLGGIPPKRDL